MKAGLLLLAGFSAGVVAQPQNHRRFHNKRHDERDAPVVKYETNVVVVTAPAVTAYVDQNGAPAAAPTQPAAYPAQAPSYPAPAPKAPTYNPAPAPKAPSYPAPAPKAPSPSPASTSSSSSPSPSSSPSSGGQDSGLGITYSPYQANKGCKSPADIHSDFQKIFQSGDYGVVRLYGTDCNQTQAVLDAISQCGKSTKVMAGIFDIDNVAKEAQAISDAVAATGGDWKRIDAVSVGNELVNSGHATPAQVASAVSQAKQALPNAPNVITIDTFVAIIAHPEMCNIGDYVGANCHAFFDGGVEASGAGKFVLDQAQRVSSACGGKKVVITETGWPNQGDSNKAAVPSMQNQAAAISSLKSSFSSNMFLFTAFNDQWKADQNTAATFNCEQYWGIIH